MITVGDVFASASKVLGTCDENVVLEYLNEAQTLLGNLGKWDPTVALMDICTFGCEITLPDDVEVPLAINVGGQPADFRNKWFEFHLNGPGTECCNQTATFAWMDRGDFPTFRSIIRPSQVVAFTEAEEDLGAEIRVFGYDVEDKWIMTPDCNGVLQDGFGVPLLSGMANGMPTTGIVVKRITRVMKPITRGFVKLIALDPGSPTGGTLLGWYRPSDTNPTFRRITVAGWGCDRLNDCWNLNNWVRMRFRRKFTKLTSMDDLIYLNSPTAIKMACMAIRKYEDDLEDGYQKYLGLAKSALDAEQKMRNGPNRMRIQFDRGVYGSRLRENMI